MNEGMTATVAPIELIGSSVPNLNCDICGRDTATLQRCPVCGCMVCCIWHEGEEQRLTAMFPERHEYSVTIDYTCCAGCWAEGVGPDPHLHNVFDVDMAEAGMPMSRHLWRLMQD